MMLEQVVLSCQNRAGQGKANQSNARQSKAKQKLNQDLIRFERSIEWLKLRAIHLFGHIACAFVTTEHIYHATAKLNMSNKSRNLDFCLQN